jgi:phage terminase large subunit-like protein
MRDNSATIDERIGIKGKAHGQNCTVRGYPLVAIQEMGRMMLHVVPMKPQGDKRARLQIVATYIKNGTVLFPRTGCEEMLGEIFNLGVESHDDLCDALVYMVLGLVSQGLELPKIQWIEA